MKKRSEGKELGFEIDDLKIRNDAISRLSKTAKSYSILDDRVFSTILQTAKEILNEQRITETFSSPPKSGLVRTSSDGIRSTAPFDLEELKGEPWGVSANGDDHFLVADGGRNQVTIWTKDGTFVKAIGPVIDYPLDVAVGIDEQVVITDCANSQVWILSKEGELLKKFGMKGSQPGQFDQPHGVTIDKEGHIIVADSSNHRIQIFRSDGTFIRCFGSKGSRSNQFNSPQGVAVSENGELVISDCGNHRIVMVDIEGKFIRTFGSKGSKRSQLKSPKGVAIDGEGRIVVAEFDNGRVSVFGNDGCFLFSFGSLITFGKPFGVAIDRTGSVLISDQGKRKKPLQLWE